MKVKSEAKSEANLTAIASATFYARLASMLGSNKFKRFMADEVSVLPWATSAIFARLKKDLLFQLKQAVNVRDISLADALAEMAISSSNAAEEFLCQSGQTLLKKHRAFKWGDGDVTAQIVAFLDTRPAPPIPGAIDASANFYLRNSVSSLAIYASSRLTLSAPTNHRKFDELLAGVTEAYVLSGYPHDLLSSEANVVRSGQKLDAIMLRREYCSTWTVRAGNTPPVVSATEWRSMAMC